jgi:hypothetical protein
VIDGLACPALAETMCTGTPLLSRSVMWVWRRQWNVTGLMATALLANASENEFGCGISPNGDVKTSSGLPPRPSLRRCSSCSFRCRSNSATRAAGILMVRALRAVFGVFRLSLPPTCR